MNVIEGQKGKSIKDLAKEELAKENMDKYKSQLKEKLKAQDAAKIIVANIDREIADLELKIKQEMDAIN